MIADLLTPLRSLSLLSLHSFFSCLHFISSFYFPICSFNNIYFVQYAWICVTHLPISCNDISLTWVCRRTLKNGQLRLYYYDAHLLFTLQWFQWVCVRFRGTRRCLCAASPLRFWRCWTPPRSCCRAWREETSPDCPPPPPCPPTQTPRNWTNSSPDWRRTWVCNTACGAVLVKRFSCRFLDSRAVIT